jgi:hypothetical protein
MEAVVNKDLPFQQANFPRLKGSNDMGWQQKGSGRVYNSTSGHSLFVGSYCRKAVAFKMYQKHCSVCSRYKEGEIVPAHSCTINHTGSSGSMELAALVALIHHLNDKKKCSVATIVTDDDSKMKASCRWNNEDYYHHGEYPWIYKPDGSRTKRRDTGQLKDPTLQPLFLADPAHRKKGFKGEIYKVFRGRRRKMRHVGSGCSSYCD